MHTYIHAYVHTYLHTYTCIPTYRLGWYDFGVLLCERVSLCSSPVLGCVLIRVCVSWGSTVQRHSIRCFDIGCIHLEYDYRQTAGCELRFRLHLALPATSCKQMKRIRHIFRFLFDIVWVNAFSKHPACPPPSPCLSHTRVYLGNVAMYIVGTGLVTFSPPLTCVLSHCWPAHVVSHWLILSHLSLTMPLTARAVTPVCRNSSSSTAAAVT